MMLPAPTKAVNSVRLDPEKVVPTAATLPPSHSVATATPKLAPALSPRIEGSAKGLAKRVCISKPASQQGGHGLRHPCFAHDEGRRAVCCPVERGYYVGGSYGRASHKEIPDEQGYCKQTEP